jgi:hypothetical protein
VCTGRVIEARMRCQAMSSDSHGYILVTIIATICGQCGFRAKMMRMSHGEGTVLPEDASLSRPPDGSLPKSQCTDHSDYLPSMTSPVFKPGIVPLHPLRLNDILKGSVAYVRINPRATLGLATVVIVIAQLVALLLHHGSLSTADQVNLLRPEQGLDSSPSDLSLRTAGATIATILSDILLSGMLTVVVGRAVFGAGSTIREAWASVRGRLLALIGFTFLVFALLAVPVVAAKLMMVGFAVAPGSPSAFVVGAAQVVALIVVVVYLRTMLAFVPQVIVLERLSIRASIKRSFALVRGSFWRIFGIRTLVRLIAWIVAIAAAAPFVLATGLLPTASSFGAQSLAAAVIMGVGASIGAIITEPFRIGADTLLYADRRMRAENFNATVHTSAVGNEIPRTDSIDDLWLTACAKRADFLSRAAKERFLRPASRDLRDERALV